MTTAQAVGAVSREAAEWYAIDWQTINRNIRRLQVRIVQATKESRWGRVRALQRLLTHSHSGKVLTISFTPTAAGPATGILTITDGAASSPQMVSLAGTGVPSLNLTTAPPATVTAGQSATYLLSIGGAGESGTAALGCTVAPAGPACSVPATVSVNGTTATTLVATATTMLRTQGAWYPHGFSLPSSPWVVAMIAVLALLSMTMSQARWRLRSLPLVALLACACGGGSTTTTTTPVGTQAGTYTITVKATLGNDSQSQKLTLIVK